MPTRARSSVVRLRWQSPRWAKHRPTHARTPRPACQARARSGVKGHSRRDEADSAKTVSGPPANAEDAGRTAPLSARTAASAEPRPPWHLVPEIVPLTPAFLGALIASRCAFPKIAPANATKSAICTEKDGGRAPAVAAHTHERWARAPLRASGANRSAPSSSPGRPVWRPGGRAA